MISLVFGFILLTFIGTVRSQVCQDPVYNRNYRWNTTVPTGSCINPKNETDVIEYVMMANEQNASIRAIGKSFSWSGIGMMESSNFLTGQEQTIYMLNMTQYMRNYTINDENQTITCSAGMRVIDVVEALQDVGLGLPDWGGPTIVNFIGSFNSGTHGKGSRRNPIGNMARMVIEFKMVLPNGTLIRCSENENSDIFHAGLISMGSLGVITEYTIQACDFYNITRFSNVRWSDAPNTDYDAIESLVENNLTKLIDSYDFYYGGYNVFREYFLFQTFNYTNEENFVDRVCWNDTTEGFNKFPCTDAYYKSISPYPTSSYTHGRNQEAEFYVHKDDFIVAYLAGIKWVIEQQYDNPGMWNASLAWFRNHSCNHVVNGTGYTCFDNAGEIQIDSRWIGADNTWLSPGYTSDDLTGEINNCPRSNGENTYDEDSVVQIGIYMPGTFEDRVPNCFYDYFVNGFYNAVKDVAPRFLRVHWGKSSLRNYCEIKDDYPKMEAFRELRQELDPKQMFVNDLVRDKLGLCGYQLNDTCCCPTMTTCNKSNDGNDGYCDGTCVNPSCLPATQPTQDSATVYGHSIFGLVCTGFLAAIMAIVAM